MGTIRFCFVCFLVSAICAVDVKAQTASEGFFTTGQLPEIPSAGGAANTASNNAASNNTAQNSNGSGNYLFTEPLPAIPDMSEPAQGGNTNNNTVSINTGNSNTANTTNSNADITGSAQNAGSSSSVDDVRELKNLVQDKNMGSAEDVDNLLSTVDQYGLGGPQEVLDVVNAMGSQTLGTVKDIENLVELIKEGDVGDLVDLVGIVDTMKEFGLGTLADLNGVVQSLIDQGLGTLDQLKDAIYSIGDLGLGGLSDLPELFNSLNANSLNLNGLNGILNSGNLGNIASLGGLSNLLNSAGGLSSLGITGISGDMFGPNGIGNSGSGSGQFQRKYDKGVSQTFSAKIDYLSKNITKNMGMCNSKLGTMAHNWITLTPDFQKVKLGKCIEYYMYTGTVIGALPVGQMWRFDGVCWQPPYVKIKIADAIEYGYPVATHHNSNQMFDDRLRVKSSSTVGQNSKGTEGTQPGVEENSGSGSKSSSGKSKEEKGCNASKYMTTQGSAEDQNFSNYVMSIGQRETGFSDAKAREDFYNQISPGGKSKPLIYEKNGVRTGHAEDDKSPSYGKQVGWHNTNVAAGVAKGMSFEASQAQNGDYGFFQTSKQQAMESGLDERTADALTNGGGKGNYSLQEQTDAMKKYIEKNYPKAATAAKEGRWADANRQLNGRWPSLPGGGSYRKANDDCANAFLVKASSSSNTGSIAQSSTGGNSASGGS